MKVKYLYEGNIYKNFMLFAIPMVITGVLSQLYNIVDTVIAGVFLGDQALAAIGALSPLVTFFSSVLWGCGCGFGIYVALLFGKKEYDKMAHSFNAFLLITLAVCAVIVGVSFFCCDFFLDVFNVDPVIREDAGIYFKTYMAGIFFIILTYDGVYVLNALSSGAFPLYMSILTTVLNIGGNLLTVLCFEWGVFGLAISSVFSSVVVAVSYLVRIWVFTKKLGVKKIFGVNFHVLALGAGYVIPPTLQQLTMYAASLLLSPVVNGLGYAMTAAYTIGSKIYDFVANVYQNSSKILGNYVAQCVGAQKYGLVKRSIPVALLQAAVFVTPFIIVCVIFPKTIASIFLSEGYAQSTMDYSVSFIKLFLPFIYFNVINNAFHNLYRGLKDKGILIVSSTIGAVSRIALSYWLTGLYGMIGFYIGWAASWIIEALFSIAVYFSGTWVPRDIKREILGKREKNKS